MMYDDMIYALLFSLGVMQYAVVDRVDTLRGRPALRMQNGRKAESAYTGTGPWQKSGTWTVSTYPAALSISKRHSGTFTQGQNATYIVTVSNALSGGPTNGVVAVTENLPSGLTLLSMTGQGWICGANACTRNDPLAGGAGFPAIEVIVRVELTAAASITNTVTISGGGDPVEHIATDTTTIESIATNLALGKAAAQSSTFSTATASRAVDGNVDGNYYGNSLTHTSLDSSPWWQVDLGSPATINAIVLWNRTDCCSARLYDYWVFVSNTPFGPTDTPAILQNRAGTWSSHQIAVPGPSASLTGSASEGRYVRVQLAGKDYLSLAEVQVFGVYALPSGSNLAIGKPAAQSSTFSTATAPRAVDGNVDGNYYDNSLTHTNLDSNAWWQVDLGSPAAINSIVIWNRTDCCSWRLGDYWVFVSDTPFGALDTPATLRTKVGTWSSHQTSVPAPSTTLAIGGVRGQYVRIQLSGTDNLSLAEVQVIGTAISPPASNLALGKAAAQSSTFASATASKAADGSTDGSYAGNSLTHTNADANAWWQVDLGSSARVTTLTIWNRSDCCSDRLNDYWIFISDTPFGPNDTPATLKSRAGTWAVRQTDIPNPSTTISTGGVTGRYVRIQLDGTNFLSLAEVQVFGSQ